jgi:hypothetical protein
MSGKNRKKAGHQIIIIYVVFLRFTVLTLCFRTADDYA